MSQREISICHAAAKLGVSETHIRLLVKKGVLEVGKRQKPQTVSENSVLLLNQKMTTNGKRTAKASFSIPQMAMKLGVCTDYIRSLIKKGIIKSQLIGKQYYIPTSEAEKFLK